jgi:hypothetical protein
MTTTNTTRSANATRNRSSKSTGLLGRLAKIGTVVAALLACAACSGVDIAGDWESKDTVAGEHNELVVEENGTGEATLYFYIDGEPYKADFDVDWEERDNGDIDFDFACEGGCSNLDFTMECELNEDSDEMECKGDNGWENYEFEWERND